MKDEMKDFQLTTFPFKSTFVLKAYDEINLKLDDQIVATQTMLSSQFMGNIVKSQTKFWETKLI